MRKTLRTGLLALGLGLGVSACSDFLSGPEVSDNPNNPTVATNRSLLVAAQANLTVQQESHLARTVCIWMQQCAGIGQQYLSLGTYSVGEDEFYGVWVGIYGQGGLLDLRRIQASTRQRGDSVFTGIAMVLETWLVGTAADVWGDVPYSQAADSAFPTPVVDPQEQVYAAIQAKLDTAIIFLAATGPTNFGPTDADLIYQGDPAKWTELAHTLKARFHLHTAEVAGDVAYQVALTEAQQGISTPDNDYLAYHSGATTEANLWSQFVNLWADYLAAGSFMVDLLQSTGDPRLEEYFAPNADDEFQGADPSSQAPNASEISPLSETRLASEFRQPLVTWAENQLIVAEAAYRTGNSGLALERLNAVRTDAGLDAVNLSGDALLQAILTEKYIRLFQNIEAWNDYRRTCFPDLTPAPGALALPARLRYPQSEANTNTNVPAPDAPEQPLRNWNDPNPC